jgi:hypothetical protein
MTAGVHQTCSYLQAELLKVGSHDSRSPFFLEGQFRMSMNVSSCLYDFLFYFCCQVRDFLVINGDLSRLSENVNRADIGVSNKRSRMVEICLRFRFMMTSSGTNGMFILLSWDFKNTEFIFQF